MKIPSLISFLLIVTISFAQEKRMHTESKMDSIPNFHFERIQKLCSKLKLDTIRISKSNWHFRLWTDEEVVEIWENNKGGFGGKLTLWTKEHTPYNETPTNRFFSEFNQLDSNQVQQILFLFDSLEINKIPSQDSIPEWKQGFDGITYLLETAAQQEYHFKTYWTPLAQSNLKEAILVQAFVSRTLKIIDSETKWYDFSTKIPFEYYTNNGSIISGKLLNRKERLKCKKDRKKFRKLNKIESSPSNKQAFTTFTPETNKNKSK